MTTKGSFLIVLGQAAYTTMLIDSEESLCIPRLVLVLEESESHFVGQRITSSGTGPVERMDKPRWRRES